MVQSLSAQNSNNYGYVNKITDTPNGRSVYQIISPEGYESAKVSIPQQDCDKFEKAYKDIVESAPIIQDYAQKHYSPEQVEKLKKKTKWVIGISTATGFLIPAVATFKMKFLPQFLITLCGSLAGFICGGHIAQKMTTPPGMDTFNRATQTLSKIDVQQVA